MNRDEIAPLTRFTGRAEEYERTRPGYPAVALNFILEHCQLKKGATLVDIGSGTGISSRAFAQLGMRVIGIEPNEDMREIASAVNSGVRIEPIYQSGKAESIELPNACADAVVCAQAFHWCEHEIALEEFKRILKKNGWVILIWNEHDQADSCTKQYSDLILTLPGAPEIQALRNIAGKPLLASKLFVDGVRATFPNKQILDEQGLIDRAFSDSCAPTEAKAKKRFTEAVRKIFSVHQKNDQIILRYQTTVYLAQKID